MKRLIVGSAVVALCGCATTGRVMEKPPQFVLQSTKSPDALEECITLGLTKLGNPFVTRGEHRRILAYGGTIATAFTVTINYGSPNTIEVRNDMFKMHRRWQRAIRECI